MIKLISVMVRQVLIVTFLALSSSNVPNRNAVHFIILQIVMKLLIDAVEFVPFAGFLVEEINFGFAVTVDTPAH